jgi:hypothetical protein
MIHNGDEWNLSSDFIVAIAGKSPNVLWRLQTRWSLVVQQATVVAAAG